MALLCLYFLSLSIIPEGPNRNLGPLAAPVFAVLSVLLFAISRRSTSAPMPAVTGTAEQLAVSAALALLPLTFIGQYLIANAYFLTLATSLRVFVAFLGATVCFIILLPQLLSRFCRIRVIAGVNCFFLLVVFSMPAVSYKLQWMYTSAKMEQVLYLVVCGSLVALLLQHSARIIAFVCVTFFVASLASVGSRHPEAFTEHSLEQTTVDLEAIDAELDLRPDIYVLTYDGYVTNETLKQLGLDNAMQERYLESSGFTHYADIYTLDIFSAESMSLVFDPGLDPSSTLAAKRRVLAGTNPVRKYFQDRGYATETVTLPYLIKDSIPAYDFTYPTVDIAGSGLLFAREILSGAFKPAFWDDLFQIARVDRTADSPELSSFASAKKYRLGAQATSPRFVVVHSQLPGHSNFLGQCNEDAIDDYGRRLARANEVMREDVARILSHDRDSLIVINGDHGPAVTGDCHVLANVDRGKINQLHLQDRWGTFLAIRWPDRNPPMEPPEPEILQDLFPAVLAYLTAEPAFLELKRTPLTYDRYKIGVKVSDGVITGGRDDGKELFSGTAF
ncbi:MAG: hypothetical protein U5O39_18720 [Gammaproteobacteria bacterium]|nr:hypothetical protein [Gammaproteobacteria bacterium]